MVCRSRAVGRTARGWYKPAAGLRTNDQGVASSWRTALSWTFAPSSTTICPLSPRSVALGQTLASDSITTAASSTYAEAAICGAVPSSDRITLALWLPGA